MRVMRLLMRVGLGLLWLLAGCHGGTDAESGPTPLYGTFTPSADPSVEIVDFSYTPATGLRVGDDVVFRVTLNKHIEEPYVDWVLISFDDNGAVPVKHNLLSVSDLGIDPDQVAGDGIYTTKALLTNPCDSLPVMVRYSNRTKYAEPMTVLPAEEEQP